MTWLLREIARSRRVSGEAAAHASLDRCFAMLRAYKAERERKETEHLKEKMVRNGEVIDRP